MIVGIAIFAIFGSLAFSWAEANPTGPPPTAWVSWIGLPVGLVGLLVTLFGISERIIRRNEKDRYR
ncbi:hypothetical protein SAMN02745244_03649 [Tessaracoccus bendigoensis DSM 12906]|uniref:Uncharacterized protein n=1 Tax=Tessaracoccus bendigoensis DSM 12906 TaxID=1123357 RepID=A0A1M6NIW0_9ACTN|nr:hypothetical protein SAMN02745244_03649 [Tessaracoccus bendigoensis DSM 12906]